MSAAADLVRRAAATRAAGAVVAALERANPGDDRTLAVLTYHRVDAPDAAPTLHPGLLSATPAAFDAQMRAVAERWTPVSLAQVLEARRGAPLPRRAVLVTFDDAYTDFRVNAWPVLQARGVPAVLFVPTGFPDDPTRTFWWDDLHHALRTTTVTEAETPVGRLSLADDAARSAAFRRLRAWFKANPHAEATAALDALLETLGVPRLPPPVLGWDDLRDLAHAGLTLAPHSVSHAMLDRLGDDDLAAEIVGSRTALQAETGAGVAAFAYPSGQHDDRVVRAVADAGFEVAFTTIRGLNRTDRTDWLRLRRINVSSGMPPAAVRAQLLPGLASIAARTG